MTVASSFHIPRSRPSFPTLPSNVSLELLDGKGVFLYGCACETDPHVDTNVPFQYYRAFFPHFPEVRHIRITSDAMVLAEWNLAAKAPTLTGVSMTREENRIRLKWTGRTDRGVSPGLEYGIRFSADGQKWRSLAAAMTEDEFLFDTELLPGGEQCRLQIVASAGFHTTIHETKPFSLPIKPRTAFIASPKPDAEYEFGHPITFAGTGFSPDFGNSKPEEIVWTSLSAGTIGVGQSLTTTELKVGHHWITMHAPDSAGSLASKSVCIRVVPRTTNCLPSGPAPSPSEQLKRPCDCR